MLTMFSSTYFSYFSYFSQKFDHKQPSFHGGCFNSLFVSSKTFQIPLNPTINWGTLRIFPPFFGEAKEAQIVLKVTETTFQKPLKLAFGLIWIQSAIVRLATRLDQQLKERVY
jgi:hypothetical protein